MPRVSTIPSAKASRNLAGSVRRLLSSIVCSYSPRSIRVPSRSPLRPTLNHIVPRRNPLAPRKGQFAGLEGELAGEGAAAGEDGRAAAGAELDRLLGRTALGEREREPG